MRSTERCTLWDELVRDAPGRDVATGIARVGSLDIAILLTKKCVMAVGRCIDECRCQG